VPELIGALERHRASAGSDDRASRARLDRARAQVWAIVGDRLRDRLEQPARRTETETVLQAVAAHEIDPYTAADRLLQALAGPT
jgi:LAO/AO transport system kinase